MKNLGVNLVVLGVFTAILLVIFVISRIQAGKEPRQGPLQTVNESQAMMPQAAGNTGGISVGKIAMGVFSGNLITGLVVGIVWTIILAL